MSTKKKILVVGGGFSGMGAIKALKEEGHTPVCYEKAPHFGGTWYYKEESVIGSPSLMPTTVINQSKEMGTFSDFVPDKKYPNYMKHSELYKLFVEYGKHFDLIRHITLCREVVTIKRSHDYDESGRWVAIIKNTESGEMREETFDGVMVGVGQFSIPKLAHYPGLDKYKGTVMHTHSLKRVDGFKDKNVLIVGVGCSGLDAAADISNVSSQVYLSTKTGTWVLPRVGPHGLPFDYCILRRISYIIQSVCGYKFSSWLLENLHLERKFSHQLYGLKPSHPALSKEPVTNDIIPTKIISGSVVVRNDVQCFTEDGVIFVGETHETKVDAVIMATGYEWNFPFLEDSIIVKEDGRINLYKCIFPPHLKHPTLAILGFILPQGPGWPLGEMQNRWVARVFSNKCRLPSEKVMMESIVMRHERNAKRYVPSDKNSIRVDYLYYLDELATEIGCKPNLLKILVTDPILFKYLLFGPSLPYQYRLEGPHKWEGARRAIITASERVRYPLLKKRLLSDTTAYKPTFWIQPIFIILLLIAFYENISSGQLIITLFISFFCVSMKGFLRKYIFILVFLPVFITYEGFLFSYISTIFIPLVLTSLLSFYIQ